MNINSALKLIKVSGPDSAKFLQGQLTCDIKQANSDALLLAAHCNVKGRIESLFQLFTLDQDFYLLMPASIIDHAFTTLKKYAVFSKVQLSIIEVTDVKLPVTLLDDFTAWRQQNIEHGIPCLFPQTIGKFLPHDVNLPDLGAVSFSKGCYIGQEIVVRMQHLGKPKWHMQQITVTKDYQPGDELEDGSIIVDCVGKQALAVVAK